MGMTIAGRRALITGASSGIGAATASVLAAAGCTVTLVGRDKEKLADVAARTGGTAMAADLTVPADLERVSEAATEADLLINNAGTGWAGTVDAMAPEDIRTLIGINLAAPMHLTTAALPHMTRRGVGHIVFVSSIAAVGVHGEAVYSATKAGLRAFAASLRYETRIGVTTVLPGAVDTPFFTRRGTPYDRGFPRQVSAETVARALRDAIERGREEIFIPGWLTLAARIQGALPGAFHQLARRFG